MRVSREHATLNHSAVATKYPSDSTNSRTAVYSLALAVRHRQNPATLKAPQPFPRPEACANLPCDSPAPETASNPGTCTRNLGLRHKAFRFWRLSTAALELTGRGYEHAVALIVVDATSTMLCSFVPLPNCCPKSLGASAAALLGAARVPGRTDPVERRAPDRYHHPLWSPCRNACLDSSLNGRMGILCSILTDVTRQELGIT